MNLCFLLTAALSLFWNISKVISHDEEQLFIDLFRGYQALVRPVQRINDTALKVHMVLQLVLLINVDEKNQIMHTNVWLPMEWQDYQLKWNPADYGGVEVIRIPPDKVWLPDIVLFNNADGNYEVSYYSNVVLDHTGTILWVPPAIYKSSCIIDVEHFPFDQQTCSMHFGSWTYEGHELELDFKGGHKGIDVTEYYKSSIWDIIDCPATKTAQRNFIRYDLILRRKTLFYTVVLIIPTVLMAFLSMMVFYLPTDAGEKITLSISILLSLVVFLLLVSKILPPTSKTIPLMAKYLLLTFILNVITILVTVIIINVYFRGPTTHRMPRWVRVLFLDFFAKLLIMKRPKRTLVSRMPGCNGTTSAGGSAPPFQNSSLSSRDFQLSPRVVALPPPLQSTSSPNLLSIPVTDFSHQPNCTAGAAGGAPVDSRRNPVQNRRSPPKSLLRGIGGAENARKLGVAGSPPSVEFADSPEIVDDEAVLSSSCEELNSLPISRDAIKTIEAIEYIAEHLKQDEEYKKVRDDWKYVAMVIDRLLLYFFFGVTLGGTVGILFSAPHIVDWVDQDKVLERLKLHYKSSI